MKKSLVLILIIGIVVALGYMSGSDRRANIEPDGSNSANDSAVLDTIDSSQDYIGLAEADAAIVASANNVPFRVVERDGEMLMITEDYRPGRINAVVEAGVVTGYAVEGNELSTDEDEPLLGEAANEGDHDSIIGMTQAEAEAYAEDNNVAFRIGFLDGEALALTMDYRPGRITAEIEAGLVTGYSVE